MQNTHDLEQGPESKSVNSHDASQPLANKRRGCDQKCCRKLCLCRYDMYIAESMTGIFQELRRRSVFGVGTTYVVVAWVLLQVTGLVLPIYDAPEWILRALTTLLFLGFPVALVLAWAYDLTPKGVKRAARARAAAEEVLASRACWTPRAGTTNGCD